MEDYTRKSKTYIFFKSRHIYFIKERPLCWLLNFQVGKLWNLVEANFSGFSPKSDKISIDAFSEWIFVAGLQRFIFCRACDDAKLFHIWWLFHLSKNRISRGIKVVVIHCNHIFLSFILLKEKENVHL